MSKVCATRINQFAAPNRIAVSIVAIALASMGSVASAQDQDSDGAEENIIVVTAQKKSQNLLDVPIAISAFDAGNIDDKVIDDAVDLSFSVPNLTVDTFGASLRGVGNLAISSTSESGLGYHVNGVYLGSAATEAEFYDLERIEVLRGPQGTLYGRNTTAGVLNVITKKATDEFEGYVTAGYGNFNSIKLRGAINLPIADGVSTRVAGFYLNRDGYTTNLFTGTDLDDRDMFGIRSSTKFEFGDTRADLVISYFREDDRRLARTKVFCTPDATLGCSPLENGFGVPDSRSTIFNSFGAFSGLITPGTDFYAGSINPNDVRLVNEDIDPTFFVEEWSGSLEITHDFGEISLTSLSGYSEVERGLFKDFDRFVASVPLNFPVTYDLFGNGNPITSNQNQVSRTDASDAREYFQELRIASSFVGPFNFILGGNYYDRRSSSSARFTSPTFAILQQANGLDDVFDSLTIESNPVTTKSFGIFGEVYVDLSDSTRITGGLRFSHDDKTIMTRQVFLTAPGPGGMAPDFTFGEFEKGVFTGRIVLDHKFTPDLLGYASFSRGYKAGGINPGEIGVETRGFDPEFLDAFEVGLKGSTIDGALTGSISAFYYDYKDLQIGQVSQTAALTVNTDATVWGVEAEFAARPSERFQVDGSFSYLNTQVKDFASVDESDPLASALGSVPAGITTRGILKNVDGNPLPFSPDIKISMGAQYEIPLGNDWSLTPRIDHYLQSEFATTIFSKPVDIFSGYSQTDLKLLLAPSHANWEIRGYVKNLFNNDDITRVLAAGPTAARIREVVILEPRTYGVEATIHF